MDETEFMLSYSREDIEALIVVTTNGFTFNPDLLEHVHGSEAWQDERGVWSRVEGMAEGLLVYKMYQLDYGVSAIVRHSGSQCWVWKAPIMEIGSGSVVDDDGENKDDIMGIHTC
jgi:hypothetical protein